MAYAFQLRYFTYIEALLYASAANIYIPIIYLILYMQTNTSTAAQYNGNQERIMKLLGSGLSAEVVANACGVTPSYVSQLLSQQAFAEKVTQLRFENLQAASARDASYDELEDKLLAKMQELLPMMYKPHEVLRAIAVINGAKRRGAGAPEHAPVNNTVVVLNIPAQIIKQFRTDINNQVVEVEGQTLVTMPSSQLASYELGQRTVKKELIANGQESTAELANEHI